MPGSAFLRNTVQLVRNAHQVDAPGGCLDGEAGIPRDSKSASRFLRNSFAPRFGDSRCSHVRVLIVDFRVIFAAVAAAHVDVVDPLEGQSPGFGDPDLRVDGAIGALTAHSVERAISPSTASSRTEEQAPIFCSDSFFASWRRILLATRFSKLPSARVASRTTPMPPRPSSFSRR